MIFRVKQPVQLQDGSIALQQITPDKINITEYSLMAIDGSTTNSGIAILRQHDGAILYLISATREKEGNNAESPVRYKVRLKQQVKNILGLNHLIDTVYYEEPVVNNITAVANLFMLRTFIEEMVIENEPEFDYLKHYEINNLRWKRVFLAPDKVPAGTDLQKEAVRNKLVKALPFLETVSQDECDALGMGFAADMYLKDDKSSDEIASKKKPHAFGYNMNFIGADSDESMLDEFCDTYTGPEKLIQNGISFLTIDGRANFDKFVYEAMGDDDKILVIKFESRYHGDLILQNRIGSLATTYDYIYVIVWRKSRKQ